MTLNRHVTWPSASVQNRHSGSTSLRTLFSRPVPARKLLVRVRHEPKDEGVSHGRYRRTDTAEACGGHGLSAGSRTVARIDGEIIARANEARSRRCAQEPASRSPRSRSTDAVRTRGEDVCGAQPRILRRLTVPNSPAARPRWCVSRQALLARRRK